MNCDPAVEDCEMMDMMDMQAAMVTAESYKTLWRYNSFFMFGLGVYYWKQYPQMVRISRWLDYRDPDVVSATKEDKEWALGTKEIMAWDITSKFLMRGYFIGLLLHTANTNIDNEGGELHFVFLRYLQVLTHFMPVVLVVMAARIYNAFDRTLAEDAAHYAETCGATVPQCLSRKTFYDYSLIPGDTSITADPYKVLFVAKNKLQTDQMVLWAAMAWNIFVSAKTYGTFVDEFNVARVQRDMDHEWYIENEDTLVEMLGEEEYESLF